MENTNLDIQEKFHLISKNNVEYKKMTKNELIELFIDVYTIRKLEEICSKEYELGNIRGFCHLVIGQESIYAILKQILDNDYVIASYRCHGLAYITGSSPFEILSEVLGKETGCSKGKGGSMHLYNDNFFGGHGIVAAQVPLGLGLAYALKYKSIIKKHSLKNVTFTLFGDGASNQGQIYESFNMAAIWKLPIVFICENNKYGMWTSNKYASANDDFYKRSDFIPGIRVNNKNISSLKSILEYARTFALTKGPIIIQIDTSRLCTHSTIDTDQKYKDIKEIETEIKEDILKNLEDMIGEKDKIKFIKENIKKKLLDSLEKAKKSKLTDPCELYTDVLIK